MSLINRLFKNDLKVVNLGLEAFHKDLKDQNVDSIHVNWRPPSETSKKLDQLEDDVIKAKIEEANQEAISRLLSAQPVILGVGKAGDDIPGMTKKTILHAGPPITWDRMSEPLRGAIVGGLIYEGLASNEEEARTLAASGEITFDSCHHHNTVGPMAGVVTYSMPVWKLQNKTFGNYAYCTFNEGLGKVLRFGAFSEEVIDRLKWIENTLAPVIKEIMEIRGPIDLKAIIGQIVQMGDEGHNRNKAGTSLVFRELAPYILKTSFSDKIKSDVLTFIDKNDHFFLNISMPACKCSLDPLEDIEYSTVVYTMSRNGTDFGIRVSGTSKEWFTAPCELVQGLYFPGFDEEDANPDIGDSCITETAGIGGFAMATAPAIVQFVGGTPKDAINYTNSMYEITLAENNAFKLPNLNFRGTPTGIDVRKVIETSILPVINTGIACNRAGVGQVGAGIVHPPTKCFEDALNAFINKYIQNEWRIQMNIIDAFSNVKMYDLTQKLSHLTPPWPTYEPLEIKFFKRLSSNGANGQVLTHSNHVGTHLDGSLHFCTHGRDIASIPLEELVAPGVVVDLSDIAEDYGIYTSKDIMDRADVRKGDILIINTGYHKYGWDEPEADEERFMVRHPGPTKEFADWCKEMEFKWIGVDCGSADHPMNTKIREWCPKEARKADKFLKGKYGKGLDDFFPEDDYQLMHYDLFPVNIIHAENLGGDIDKVLGKRLVIGCFPWRFEGGESCIARIVAFDTK